MPTAAAHIDDADCGGSHWCRQGCIW